VATGACGSRTLQAAITVFSIRDRFEMARIDARAHATEMIELQSGRDWADVVLITPAVRQDAVVGHELPITVSRQRAGP
jgi:hypothetical protein